MVRILKVLVVIALVAVLVAGLTTSACCDGTAGNGNVPSGNANGDVTNGNEPNGNVPNGNEPNGNEPNGNEPAEPVEPAEPDLSSGLGLITDCEEYDGPSFQDSDPAPIFHFQDAAGTTFALSDFRGRAVMLNFWRTTCGPCIMEMPHLQEVYNEWQGGEVVMLIINIGEDADTVEDFLDTHGLSLPVLLDRETLAAAQYRTFSIPCTFFIDKAGGIRGIKFGAFQSAEELESMLEQLITL
jgi:peroxiredoxin